MRHEPICSKTEEQKLKPVIFIIFFLVAIVTVITLGVYYIPKILGYPKVAKYMTIIFVLCLVYLVGMAVFEERLFSKGDAKELVGDTKKIFEKRTGLSISNSISNIDVNDNYELMEGEFSIVFKTSESQIKHWLSGKPPWNNIKWHKGQIPHKLGASVKFNFADGVGLGIYNNGESIYLGDKDLVKLLNDTTNYYSYVEDCCPDQKGLRFHDGRLLILQPRTRMVYYSVWDF